KNLAAPRIVGNEIRSSKFEIRNPGISRAKPQSRQAFLRVLAALREMFLDFEVRISNFGFPLLPLFPPVHFFFGPCGRRGSALWNFQTRSLDDVALDRLARSATALQDRPGVSQVNLQE